MRPRGPFRFRRTASAEPLEGAEQETDEDVGRRAHRRGQQENRQEGSGRELGQEIHKPPQQLYASSQG